MDHSPLDLAWVALTSALVFVMQAGFALLESGLTRSKNSINVAVKNLTDLGISVLCFWAVGFGLMFGTSAAGWTGADRFFFAASGAWPGVFFLFQAMFCSTSATIVSGAVAERMRFGAYIAATVLMAVVIYPVAGHWAWGGGLEGHPSGWLGSRGFVDFAGSTVVHSVGGWVSLAALLVLGPRIGRYDDRGRPRAFPGSNVPMAVVGAMLLWFGWFGFNGGSTLGVTGAVPKILVNTTLAAAAGMVATLALGWSVTRRPDVGFIINGSLGGLVAITAGCHAVTAPEALLIGAVGGALTFPVQALLDRWKVDDAVGAIPVHLGAGVWGTLAVGLFGDPATLATGLDRGSQVLIQGLGIVLVGAFSFGVSWAFFSVWNRFFPLRVTPEEEAAGLNVSEHGTSTEAYGLFQTLETQARTGDLSLRAPSDPFTEVGQIADRYNRVLDSLEDNVVAKSEYLNILDNLHEGLFLLDQEGRIGPFYSAALEAILEVEGLAGASFASVLEKVASPATVRPWADYLGVLFDPAIDATLVGRLNPLREVELSTGLAARGLATVRHGQFQFRRVLRDGQVVRVVAILRDATEEVSLKKSLDSQQRERSEEMELFYRLLHVDPVLLGEFLEGFTEKVGQVNRIMETGQNAPREVIKQSLRILHGLKGEAQFLELDFVAGAIHRLETLLADLQGRPSLENRDFVPFTLDFGRFQETGDRMATLIGKLASFQASYLQADAAPGSLVVQLDVLVSRTARARGKLAKLEAGALRPSDLDRRGKVWKDILVQLVRNAVVHGIEGPPVRQALGKAETGTVTLASKKVLGGVEVTVRDDGSGLDLAILKRRAMEAGWQDWELNHWSRTEWVRFIFTDGVTTAEAADLDAGRGVGLALVGRLVKGEGGRISVRFEAGRFLEFRVVLPDRGRPLTEGSAPKTMAR